MAARRKDSVVFLSHEVLVTCPVSPEPENDRLGPIVESPSTGLSAESFDADQSLPGVLTCGESLREIGLKPIEGARVVGVERNGPADKAGVRKDDVVVEWDGHGVGDATELTLLVGKAKIGSRVKVTAIRDGERIEFELTVGERPPRAER